jgi:MFS superfamily sulfate permease-like transporter
MHPAQVWTNVAAPRLRWPTGYRLSRSEISGAFADLGLLIPLEAALIAVNGLNPTSTLLGVGIFYIAAGWYFGLPMPVQPLKALAAIAIARELAPDVIAAGALLMTVSLAFLAVIGLIDRLYSVVPTAVVRGVQLGLAYVLIRGAINLLEKPLAPDAAQASLSIAGASVPFMVALAPLFLLGIALLVRKPLVPASLAVLVAGIATGIALGRWDGGAELGPAAFSAGMPGLEAFGTAAAVLLTAQLPLTLANSVIATADASARYFPEQAGRATPRRLSLSIAAGNLWAGFFGGLPVCHGSGGLTAHYRLGARTPMATTLLGLVLVGVALALGLMAQDVRTLIPLPFFGVLLLYVGVQHVALAANVERSSDLLYVALAGILTAVFDGNLAYAAGITLGCYWGAQLVQKLRSSMRQEAPAS